MARTLIDALWYFGGNRDRGIGKYLDYFFREVFPTPPEDRFWLVPQSSPDWQVNKFLVRYGGQSIELDTEMSGQRQSELLDRWLDDKEIIEVFIASPFERPRSLLDFVSLFDEKALIIQCIVFDLLPLQFREKILEEWPEEDQELYERRLRRLRRVHRVFAISPQTQAALSILLDYPAEQTEVLKFGLGTKWIEIPKESVLSSTKVKQKTRVLTISGGEWRKNLDGTLEYFAQTWKGKKAELVIICELGMKHTFSLAMKCVRLGILPQVRFLGKVSEKRKWRELHRADVFLFLSRGEGLGIPLLEARKAKIPRIILSKELADQGFGELVEKFELAEEKKNA
jgi:hypothetical protein